MTTRAAAIALALAMSAGLACGACVRAPPLHASEPRSRQVSMSNIDTSTEIGAERLLRRIRDVALADCDRDAVVAGWGERWRGCMYASMNGFVVQTRGSRVRARFARNAESMIAASAW